MPPPHEILTDDYVAELLAKEAGDCSLKYSTMGLDAFKSSNKRPANQPKPNTRFLNNIIRDTNSHNRALLAKENAESRARLRELEEADKKKRDEEKQRERRSKPGPGDTRKRMLGDIAAILGGPSKRGRRNDGSGTITGTSTSTSTKRARSESNSDEDRARPAKKRESRRPTDGDKSKSHSGTGDRNSKSRESHENHEHSHRRRERSRDRSRGHGVDSRDEREHQRRRDREHRRDKDDGRNHHHHRHHSEKKETHKATRGESRDRDRDRDLGSDSDPLDDIIGPEPPSKSTVRRRGRGLNAAMSGIDGRFAADYDPTVDVTPDPDDAGGDDWDNAVETFRDRQKWKQQGADRLRSAGFTEDQVRKWEKGDRKDESDVRWNKAGDVREWDREKVADLDDGVSLEPEFGRLKGT